MSRRGAEVLASSIGVWARSTDRPLQRDTTLEQILSWMGAQALVELADDYDKGAERALALEEERFRAFPKQRKPVFPDVMLGKPMQTTFTQLVGYQAERNRVYDWADRVGREYQPDMPRYAAQDLALTISVWARSTDRPLQRDTTLEQILSWMGAQEMVGLADDYHQGAERALALVEERSRTSPREAKPVFPDVMLGKPMQTTFAELVESQAERKARGLHSLDAPRH